MTRAELTDEVVQRTGFVKGEVDEVVKAAIQVAIENLSRGKPIFLRGFGTFSVLQYRQRYGRDLSRGVTIPIPARRGVKFKPCHQLRNLPEL